ncbi:MAG: hypothetical protein PHN82_05530 [bacterium]|nr:hypothetical protein [bacterium]
MNRRRVVMGAAAVAALPALLGAQPAEGPEADGAMGVVEEAIGRGGRVILKRVDYLDGGAGAGDEAGAVRSRTYIEIDTRAAVPVDEDLLRSQERVEEGQREMLRAVDAIGRSQERQAGALGTIESSQADISSGMRGDAAALEAAREADAEAADGAIGDSRRLLGEIEREIRSLSGAVGELSSRVEAAGRGPAGDAP